MKIETLKINTLYLITNEANLTVNELPSYYDNQNYNTYLVGVIPALNIAITRINASNILPYKTFLIDTSKDVGSNSSERTYDLNELGIEYYKIKFVMGRTKGGRSSSNISYLIIGNLLVVSDIYESLTIVYSPRIPLLDVFVEDSFDLSEIGLPSGVQTLLPYFVVSEVYFGENPDVALKYKDIFESYIGAEDKETTITAQSNVVNVREWD